MKIFLQQVTRLLRRLFDIYITDGHIRQKDTPFLPYRMDIWEKTSSLIEENILATAKAAVDDSNRLWINIWGFLYLKRKTYLK